MSRFCPACRGDRAVEAVGGIWRDDDYVSVPCPTCSGKGGFGPAFKGDAVPADQAALDVVNREAAKQMHPAYSPMPGVSTSRYLGTRDAVWTDDDTEKA